MLLTFVHLCHAHADSYAYNGSQYTCDYWQVYLWQSAWHLHCLAEVLCIAIIN